MNHRKFAALDPAAIGLWTMGSVYCWDQLTDGVIPRVQLPRLIRATPAKCRALADMLVKAGLWEPEDGDYRVHDWLDWNPPAEKIRTERAAHRERMRAYRRGSSAGARAPERAPARESARDAARAPARARQDVDVDVDTPRSPVVGGEGSVRGEELHNPGGPVDSSPGLRLNPPSPRSAVALDSDNDNGTPDPKSATRDRRAFLLAQAKALLEAKPEST